MANGCCGGPVVTPSPVGYGNAAEATDAILAVDDGKELLVIPRSSSSSWLTMKKSVERMRRMQRMGVDEWDQPLEFAFC